MSYCPTGQTNFDSTGQTDETFIESLISFYLSKKIVQLLEAWPYCEGNNIAEVWVGRGKGIPCGLLDNNHCVPRAPVREV